MNLLAISGSLRANSSNTFIIRTLAALATEEPRTHPQVNIIVYEDLGELPHFNPDLDQEPALPSVERFRSLLKASDGVILCTPEYAFGIPGVLKNALDWVVSSGEFQDKPTVAISASPSYLGGDKALASLLLTLGALGARIVEGGSLKMSFIGKKLNPQGEVTDTETLQALRDVFVALVLALGPAQETPNHI